MKTDSDCRQLRKIMTGAVLFVLFPFFVYGQLADPVSFTIDAGSLPAGLMPGEHFTVTVQSQIEGDWHLYSVLNDPAAGPVPTTFSAATGGLTITGQIAESQAQITYDPNFDTELGLHSGSAFFRIPLVYDSSLRGEQPLKLSVLYQVCDDISCLPPKNKTVSAEIRLADPR